MDRAEPVMNAVVKWGAEVSVSREMLGLPPLGPPPPVPPLRLRVFYWLRRRWWGLQRLPGYRLAHKDDIGCPRCD